MYIWWNSLILVHTHLIDYHNTFNIYKPIIRLNDILNIFICDYSVDIRNRLIDKILFCKKVFKQQGNADLKLIK